MRCISQKLETTARAKPSVHTASAASRFLLSRSPVHNASVTPDAPKPSSAVEITRKPKWYQSETDSTRVSASDTSLSS
jgi:hypothetical protein